MKIDRMSNRVVTVLHYHGSRGGQREMDGQPSRVALVGRGSELGIPLLPAMLGVGLLGELAFPRRLCPTAYYRIDWVKRGCTPNSKAGLTRRSCLLYRVRSSATRRTRRKANPNGLAQGMNRAKCEQKPSIINIRSSCYLVENRSECIEPNASVANKNHQ
jgi:hypothetical protein